MREEKGRGTPGGVVTTVGDVLVAVEVEAHVCESSFLLLAETWMLYEVSAARLHGHCNLQLVVGVLQLVVGVLQLVVGVLQLVVGVL